jgi:CRP/FNR family cyclic AMP-dependent transcriptional regulator
MMPLEEEVQVVSTVEILGPLSEEEIRELLRQTPDTHLYSGETFYTPEDATEKLFILKKGRVRIFKTADGRPNSKGSPWPSGEPHPPAL